MKTIPLFTLIFGLITFPALLSGQAKKKFKEQLEPNSKVIDDGVNYTVEKINDTTFIYKKYYPENHQVTHYVTFDSEKLHNRHGLYEERYDDGTLVQRGIYMNNLKEGVWIEDIDLKGFYKAGIKQGKWVTLYSKGNISSEVNYSDGLEHGEYITYDTLGNIEFQGHYEMGKKLWSDTDTEVMPRFPGCEQLQGNDDEKNKCATSKLLNYIYKNLGYPKRAREDGIEGMALIQFVVDKDGSIMDITVRHGISKEIKEECVKLITGMPKWRPGEQDGKFVKVLYTLPIRFQLE